MFNTSLTIWSTIIRKLTRNGTNGPLKAPTCIFSQQTKILCFGYVSLPIRCRPTRRSSTWLYRFRYLRSFQEAKGIQRPSPHGYDAFGLPAEQYAIQTGNTRKNNRNKYRRYRQQLDNRFRIDWSREFKTTDPSYYKWTQWIFIQLFDAWYDHNKGASRHITLIAHLRLMARRFECCN